jgi:branched-chain amino acid transport system substrate-binding protein
MFCSCLERTTPAERRENKASAADEKNRDITIALVRTSANSSLFAEGALLALEEINGELDIIKEKNGEIIKINKKDEEKNEEGGVLIGRKIKYQQIVYNDEGDSKIGASIATEISKDLDVIAVIGHRFSSVAIPVSIIYEQQGIVFISTGSTTPLLTTPRFHYVFRNIPTDKQIGKALAIFAKDNFKRISIFFQRGDYGERLSGSFREEAEKLGISIIATRSYFKTQRNFRQLLEGAQDHQLDAIFLAGFLPAAADLIKQARSMGLSMPFIAGDALENPDLWLKAGLDAVDTYVAGAFNIESESGKEFIEKFKKRYRCFDEKKEKKKEKKEKDKNCFYVNDVQKKYPHANEKDENGDLVTYTYAKAAQGYDAVRLLAWAIENSRSTVPLDIASTLKYMKKWNGVLGSYSFASNGDVKDKEIHIKVLSYNGKFKKQASITSEKMENKREKNE